MIGGWQSYIKQQGRAMFGRRRDGFLIEEGFITATIVVTILERKKISGFAQFFSEQRTQTKIRSRKRADFRFVLFINIERITVNAF